MDVVPRSTFPVIFTRSALPETLVMSALKTLVPVNVRAAVVAGLAFVIFNVPITPAVPPALILPPLTVTADEAAVPGPVIVPDPPKVPVPFTVTTPVAVRRV